MPKNISNSDPYHSDGVFAQVLVNTFAARVNSNDDGFLVYNSTPTSPLFKIDGSGVSPTATFYCDLNVIGSASFTSVSNVAVTSSMMSLATGNTSSDLIDIGFYGLYTSSGSKYRGLVKSVSLNRWVLFKEISTVPSSTVTLSGSWRDNLEVLDLYFNGDGSTISALKTDVDLFPDALQSLTTAEINQLQNINSNTISSTQWGYIAASNQRTDTAGTPSFSGLTLSTGVVSLPVGSFITPTLNFSDTGSGFYRPSTNQIGLSTNGTLNTYWTTGGMFLNTGVLTVTAGIVGTPSLNFGNSTTGFYQAASNQIGLSVSGSNLVTWNSTGETLASGALRVPNGTVGTPSFNLGSTTTGFYQPGSNQIGIAVSGSLIGTWSSTGLAMNTLDISGISTLTATTLAGTLSTVSQPNVTTMAGIASIGTSFNTTRINGQVSFNGTAFDALTEYSFSANSSFYDMIQINGTLGTQVDTNNMYLVNAIPNIRTGGSDMYGIRLSPFYIYYGNSSLTYSLYISPSYSFNNGAVLDSSYGVFVTNQAAGTNTSITGYFDQPSAGSTVSIGVYTGSLTVGSTVTNPPTNGILSSGHIMIGTDNTITTHASTTKAIQILSTLANASSQITCSNSTSDTFFSIFSGNNTSASSSTSPAIITPNVLRFLSSGSYSFSSSTEVARFSSANLLIGTSANTNSRRLMVNGDIEGTNLYGTISTTTQNSIDTMTGLSTINSASTVTISGAAITNAQWNSYIGTMDQSVASSSSPTFSALTVLTSLTTSGSARIILQVGAVGAPTLYFSGSTTTGFYRPSANTIGIAVSGSLVGTWSSTGLAMNTLAISGISTASGSTASFTTLTGTLSTAAQANVTSLGTLTGLTMGGALNLATNNITNGGTITATTLTGTLSTASQPNITTLAGVTTIGSTNVALNNPGLMVIGGSTASDAILTIDNTTTYFTGNRASIFVKGTINLFTSITGSISAGLRLNDTLTSSGAFNSDEYHAVYIVTTLSPFGGSSNLFRGITVAPTVGTAGSSNDFIGINIVPGFSNGTNLTTLSGITVTDFTGAASTITSVIGGSFPHPGVSSSGARMGIFAGSLSVGDNTKAMTSSNLYVAGTTTCNSTAIFAAGLVGTPSLYMSTDSTTGLYRPGTNQIGIAVSGSLVGTWSSTGLAMNTLAISGISTASGSTASFTTLTGTLSTASQPNITTLAGLTSVGTSGNVAVLNRLSVGTASPVASAELYVTGSGNTELWVNSPEASICNIAWGKNDSAKWQNYVPANSADLRWYRTSDIMTLTETGTLSTTTVSATTLTGTLSTAAQPNITSVGTLTSLIVNGKTTIGSSSAPSSVQYILATGSLAMTAANGQYMTINPTMTTTTSSTTHIGLFMNPTFSIAASQTLTNAASLFVETGAVSLGGGAAITNGYSAYFSTPAFGTNKFAVFTTNLAVGSSTVPPTNGIYCSGNIKCATVYTANDLTPDSNFGFITNTKIANGSGAAGGPSYTFFSDNTTGMYFTTNNLNFSVNAGLKFVIDSNSNVVSGAQSALATNATNGFLYIPTSAGAPTGVPTAFTGKVAMEYDTTNNRLYVYNGAWRSVVLA